MKKFLIISFILFFGTVTYATNWVEFGYKLYIDMDTIKFENDGTVSFWQKSLNEDVNKNTIKGIKWYYILSYHTIDCYSNKIKVVTYSLYDLKDKRIFNVPYVKEEYIIYPDSDWSLVSNYLCKRK